jgi:hypothetical protein
VAANLLFITGVVNQAMNVEQSELRQNVPSDVWEHRLAARAGSEASPDGLEPQPTRLLTAKTAVHYNVITPLLYFLVRTTDTHLTRGVVCRPQAEHACGLNTRGSLQSEGLVVSTFAIGA